MTNASDYLADIGADVVRKPRRKKTRKVTSEPTKSGLGSVEFLREHYLVITQVVVVAGFLGAAVLNTVFLQDGKHPSPIISFEKHNRTVDQTQTAAIPQPRSKQIIIGEANQPSSDPLVRQIQRLLSERGYYAGEVDGIMGAKTRDAIGTYQQTFAQTVDYAPSQALLEHIRLSTTELAFHEKARARLDRATSTHVKTTEPEIISNKVDLNDRETVKRVQQALLELGVGNLVVDGLIGPNTRKVIGDFQRRQGLRETGKIDPETLSELGRLNVL